MVCPRHELTSRGPIRLFGEGPIYSAMIFLQDSTRVINLDIGSFNFK